MSQSASSSHIAPTEIKSITRYPENFSFRGKDTEVPSEVLYPLNRHFRKQKYLELMDEASGDSVEVDQFNGLDSDLDVDMEDDRESENDNLGAMSDDLNRFSWGYKVHELWSLPATHRDSSNRPLSRFKLMLDQSHITQPIRDALSPTLNALQEKKIIHGPLDVIADYLTYLLQHTQSELEEKHYDQSYLREIVLCVPAIWTEKACRQMQTALATAMKDSKFQNVSVENNSIENLFIVSEPEAAAAYMLSINSGLVRGDVFVLLDAGGGTVDANTYQISNKSPLRLSTEVVPPGGGLHGSNYINQSFRRHLYSLLKDENYLEQGPETIDGIIETIMITHFEYRIKRGFDFYKADTKRFPVLGLRDNPKKGFVNGYITVQPKILQRIFLEHLIGINTIMEGQITAAMRQGSRVQKVLVIGGFAASVSLQKYLRNRLAEFNKTHGCGIQLDFPTENVINPVSSGAVLRAVNKERGPERVTRSSYGVIRTEPFGDHKEHNGVKPKLDPHDGVLYIKQTVDWVLKLGTKVSSVWESKKIPCSHTFRVWPPCRLVCREILYVSDVSTESHFKLSDSKNKGAEKVGEIVVDFSYLRDEGTIKPIDPKIDEDGKKIGTRHYKVTYDLVIRVVDRDLECLAIYNETVKQKCRINIAPGFLPGVK